MGVRFDYGRCIVSLKLVIMKALKQMQREFMDQARSEGMSSQASNELSEGDFELMADAITVTVVGGPWVAMNEWGTGSELDVTNPAFVEYVRSGMFYHERLKASPIFSKLGRPKGSYLNIFGERVESTGKLKNRNLEELAEQGVLPSTFLPTPPKRSLETAARWLEQRRAAEILQEAIDTFPWGNFLVAYRTVASRE